MHGSAEQILAVFKARGLHAGAQIRLADFGDAIVWEGGYTRDEHVREALRELIDEGYVLEHLDGLELTNRGDHHLYGIGGNN